MVQEAGDTRLWRAYLEGDLPGYPTSIKYILNESRRIFAMVHHLTPPCEIGKYARPYTDRTDARKPPSEQHVITMFECQTKKELRKIWYAKERNPSTHKRLFPLGELPLKINGETVHLAVSFRRFQQLAAWDIEPLHRVGRLSEYGLKAISVAYEDYRAEGQPNDG